MPTLTIHNVPPDLLTRLRAAAKRNQRSLNTEVVHRLNHSVGMTPTDPVELIEQARRLRARARLPFLDEDGLNAAKGIGRG